MSDCPFLASCPFFNDKLANTPATAEMMKRQYCKGNPNQCARLIVRNKLGPQNVPPDLFPSNKPEALRLIG